MSPPEIKNPDASILLQLGQVQGQLLGLTQMIQSQHDSTGKRMDDFQHAMESRLSNVEDRIGKVEDKERGTAIKAAGGSALVVGVIELLKHAAALVR
jgi:hypothetical protein